MATAQRYCKINTCKSQNKIYLSVFGSPEVFPFSCFDDGTVSFTCVLDCLVSSSERDSDLVFSKEFWELFFSLEEPSFLKGKPKKQLSRHKYCIHRNVRKRNKSTINRMSDAKIGYY